MVVFDPNELLHFIEVGAFTRNWKDLELDDEADLAALQFLIMANPTGPPVVSNTGGLRKLRFSPPRWNRGKRGAARVCYVYFEEFGIVPLVTIYDKHDKDDLTSQEKKVIRGLVAEANEELQRRKSRHKERP